MTDLKGALKLRCKVAKQGHTDAARRAATRRKRKIGITLYCRQPRQGKNLRLTQVPELNQGESRATALRVDVPQEYADFDYYLEFFCPKNKKFIVGPLEEATDTVVENQLEYVLDGCILSDAGTVYIQLCARKEGEEQVIFKSTRSSNASFSSTSP